MKNFKFKWLLLSIVLSIASINTAWAWSIWGGKTIYIDNSIAKWSSIKMKFNNSTWEPGYTQIGSTSFYYCSDFSNDFTGYDNIVYFKADDWTHRTAQQKYDIHPSYFAVIVPKGSGTDVEVGYFTDTRKATPNHRLYFDATPIDGWGAKAYLRYGFDCVAHADPMTKFPGTANLFYVDISEAYYDEYTVANNAGYTESNRVWQPTKECEPTGDYKITKSLNFSNTNLDGGDSKILKFVPTTKASNSYGCDWYNYDKTSNSSIPTQTVKIGASALSHGAVRVSYYNTSGSSTTTDLRAANASITVPQSAIIQVTAIPDAGYYCTGITVGGSGYTAGDDYTVTATTTIAATFDYRWSIAGGNESNPDAMGDWNINANIIAGIGKKSSKDTGFVDISLPANTYYEFLIKDKGADVWYKNSSTDDVVYTMTYGNSSNWDFGTDKYENCGIRTAGAGTYKFAWNITDKTLTVYYPTSYTVTFGYGDHGSSVTASGSGSGAITSGKYVASGENVTFTETHDTGYNLKGWYTASSGGTAVSTMSSSDNILNSIAANANVYAQYVPKTNTINLDANGGSGSPLSVTATYDSSDFSETVTSPEKSNYLFAGWYNDEDGSGNGSGTQVIDATGALIADVDGYTDEDGNWNNTTEEVIALHAKWISLASIELTCWSDDGNGVYTWNCDDIAGFDTPKPSATTWSTATNWGNGSLPTLATKVVLTSNMTVDADHAKAKEIVLKDGVKLTIDPNKGLEVAGTITKADGSAPTASDLILESSSAGNATLIFDNSNSAAATVQMYSKASVVGNTWNWQFIGIPYTSVNALQYYGSYLFKWLDDGSGWDEVGNGETLYSFKGYCITNKSAGETYTMTGTLDETDTKELTISIPAEKEFVIGNSWTAPIYIKGFTSTTLPLADKSIYIFNTGYKPAGSGGATAYTGDKYEAGTYVSVPIEAADFTGDHLIAPLQGFYVDNRSGSAATITMKYDELVRPSGTRTQIIAGQMHAPKRTQATENDPVVMKIWANGSVYNDRLILLERSDFSTGFDNGWDGKKMSFGTYAPSVYMYNADNKAESVSAISDLEGTVVSFRAGKEDSQYTFTFEYEGEGEWYLNDLKEEQSTLISTENTYAFTADENEDAEARFVISKTPIKKITTGVDVGESGVNARKQIINGTLYIVRDGRIYNAEGAVVK